MSSSIKLALVAALDREVGPLVKHWRVREKEYAGRTYRFFENGNAVAVCGGIGPAAARRAAEAMIALYTPALVYSAGFAGATGPELKVGDIVIPRRVVDAGDGSAVDSGTGEGVLVSFASVAGPEQKARLRDSFGAQAVDMEAAAVAKAAQARGVPFGAVKAISDETGFDLPPLDRFVGADGQFRTARFILFAIPRPWIWGSMLRLKRNSDAAARALCQCLRGVSAEADLPSQPATNEAKVLGSK